MALSSLAQITLPKGPGISHYGRDKRECDIPVAFIFINRYFHPDLSATSQMLTDLAFDLTSHGEAVAVLTSRQKYDDSSACLPAHEWTQGVEIVRLRGTRFGRAKLGGRSLDYLTFHVSAVLELLKRARREDIIIAKSDPPMLSLIAAPIAAIKGAKYVNWLQDIFPEVVQALRMGQSPLARVGLRVLIRMRNLSLRAADLNFVPGSRMADQVASCGVAREKICVIENWADGSVVRPIEPSANRLRREWGLHEQFVVGYSGNLGRAHDVKTLLDAATRCAALPAPPGRPPIVWLVTGGGVLYEQLMAEARARSLASILFKPYQPRERLAESLSVANVHLVSLKPELEGLLLPSKFYGIAAAGRPAIFIGAPDGEIASLIRTHHCGFAIPEGDGAALARVVEDLASNQTLCAQLGAAARALFEREYDAPVALAKWRRHLDELKGRAKSGRKAGPQVAA